WRIAEHRLEAAKKARLRDDDGRHTATSPGGSEIGRQVVFRSQRRQGGDLEFVVGLDGIAVLHPRPLPLCELSLERNDVVGSNFAIRLAREREQPSDMRAIGRAYTQKMRIVLQVIVAVGQAEPTLPEMRDVGRGVALVRRDVEREGNTNPEFRKLGEQSR